MKVQKIITAPSIIDPHSGNFIFTAYPLSYKQTQHPASSIMVREQTMGASTGAIQATGMRNNRSHVKKDGGQFKSRFNQT